MGIPTVAKTDTARALKMAVCWGHVTASAWADELAMKLAWTMDGEMEMRRAVMKGLN
jgi:hypothetical protein